MRLHGKIIAVALFAAFSVASAADTITLKQRIVAGPDPTPREQMQYYTANKRIIDDSMMRSIIDLDAKTVTIVQKPKKTYSVSTFEHIRKQNEELQKMIESMPPQVQQMMGHEKSTTLKPTGKSETIAGHTAKEYTIEGGPVGGSVWVAEDLELGARRDEWAKLADDFGGGAKFGGAGFSRAMAQLKGLPLRQKLVTTLGPHGTTNATTEVVEITDKAPPPEVLTVPEGFKKVDPPSLPKAPAAPPAKQPAK